MFLLTTRDTLLYSEANVVSFDEMGPRLLSPVAYGAI